MEWGSWVTWRIVFLSDIQDYFEDIFKNVEADIPSIKVNVNKKNRITFTIKTGCYLEILMPKAMKLLESNKIKITKDKSGKNYWDYWSSTSPL